MDLNPARAEAQRVLAAGGEGVSMGWAPWLSKLLDPTAVSPPNRLGDSGTVYDPSLPESVPKQTNPPFEQVYHIRDEEGKAKPC